MKPSYVTQVRKIALYHDYKSTVFSRFNAGPRVNAAGIKEGFVNKPLISLFVV